MHLYSFDKIFSITWIRKELHTYIRKKSKHKAFIVFIFLMYQELGLEYTSFDRKNISLRQYEIEIRLL